jgi:uncharacterized protein (DUF433 family)
MATAPPIPASAPVGIRVDKDGRLRVGNSRVLVEGILILYRSGETAEQLLENFPTMAPEDLFATLAYYLRHRPEMDAWIDEVERETERVIEMIDAHPRSRAANEKFHKLFEEQTARVSDSTPG